MAKRTTWRDNFKYHFEGLKQIASLTQKQMRYAGFGSAFEDFRRKGLAYLELKEIEKDRRDKIKKARAELKLAKRAKDSGRAEALKRQINELTKTMKDAKKHARMAQKYETHEWGKKLWRTQGHWENGKWIYEVVPRKTTGSMGG